MRRFVKGDVLIQVVTFPHYLRAEAIWFHDELLILVDRSLSPRQREEAVIRLLRRQLDSRAAAPVLDTPLRHL